MPYGQYQKQASSFCTGFDVYNSQLVGHRCSAGKTICLIKRHHCIYFHFHFKAFEPHILEAFKAFQYLWDFRSTFSYLSVSILIEIFVVYLAVSFNKAHQI